MTNKNSYSKGQSLFELVVAIAVSALIIVAMVSLTTNSIRNSSYSRNKTQAVTFSQQAVEWLRGERDNDTEDFIYHSITPAWCLPSLEWSIPASNPVADCTAKISGTVFSRWVTFDTTLQSGKTVVEASVVVTWSDAEGLHEIRNSTILTDWRQR